MTQIDTRINLWLMQLEASRHSQSMPTDLHETVKQGLWLNFRHDHCLIVNEFKFYHQLSPKMQNELVALLFPKFLDRFADFFTGCEQQFINYMTISMSYNRFEHGQVIQTPKYDCQEIYCIYRGGVAVCEPTSFGEPILVYGPSSVINIYQILMDHTFGFKYVAVNERCFARRNASNEVLIT